MSAEQAFDVFPVGHVRRDGGQVRLEILKSFAPALKQLEHFSHVHVFWWAVASQEAERRAATQCQPPYEGAPLTGVFACRSPARPNPVGLTIAKVLQVDLKRGVVEVANLDAHDGTPILDLKPHIPADDRVREAQTPPWLSGWPEWLPDEDLGLNAQSGSPQELVGSEAETFQLFPVGQVQQADGVVSLDLDPAFAPALKHLEQFSHVRVLWWFHRFGDDRFRRSTQNTPPYENAPVTGVFASRSPVRPNPIGLTTAEIVRVDHKRGRVEVAGLDAYDDTPLIDLKPYVPGCDRVRRFTVPRWIAHWPEWMRGHGETTVIDPRHLRPADSQRLAAFQTAQPAPLPQERATVLPPKGGELEGGEASDDIVIRGARQHNLKNVDLSIPRNKLTVITGVSGSGKSSLAFDTLYAEGQRRYVESLSTLARRLVGQMEKPAVDQILGLNPTIAIEQRAVSRNPRSTVGTATEVYDYLRVLFARVGVRHCPQCGRAIRPHTARQIARQLAALLPGTHFQLLTPAGQPLEQLTVPDEADAAFRKRLLDAVQAALGAGNGYLTVMLESGQEVLFSQHLACPHCQRIFFELNPALFSFNNPDGMCPDCNGLGVKLDVDLDLVVTQPELSLLDGASPWYGEMRHVKPSGNWMRCELWGLAEHYDVDLELPWNELPQEFRHAALYGSGDEIITWSYDVKSSRGRTIGFERPAQGAVNNIKRLLQRTNSERSRQGLLQFMSEQPCPTCGGERLCTEARFVAVAGARFPQAATMTVEQIHAWVADLPRQLTSMQNEIAGDIVEELLARLQCLLDVGLHYLTLDRPAPTLSGGEGQRIRLATQLGCGLTGLLYVLDEPSIGLHPRDHHALLQTMRRLRDGGNTVVVVEHDADTMRAADWLIDLGPGAGALGGKLVAAGTPEQVMAHPDSLTGKYLRGKLQVHASAVERDPQGWLTVVGARLHNLKRVDARFPLGLLTCVSGVSGSGKSSLVTQTLSPALARALHGAQQAPGPHERIEGLEQVNKVINVTQSPIGRTPRSNPCTYVGAFDEVRKVFARTPEARARGYKAGRFSFNGRQGRCEPCQGHGRRRVEMHFLPDVWVTCSECEGRRFNRETLEVEYKGKSIADVLDMDVQEALEFFAGHPKITRLLQTLRDVGLEYVKLGQSALTLSGGEAQRVKLAKELGRKGTGRTLYVLDEPTTGLHFADIQKLLDVLQRLTAAGNTVIVIEHNLDVLKTADWIIDLGPEGGQQGGELVACGTPEQIAQVAASHTGRYLATVLA
jgi:excinuclease ABC subunit A